MVDGTLCKQIIENEAGWELYCWAPGRRDWNDFGKGYVKAVHNLKGPQNNGSSGIASDYVWPLAGKHHRDEFYDVIAYGSLKRPVERKLERVKSAGGTSRVFRRILGLQPKKEIVTETVYEEQFLGEILEKTSYPEDTAVFMSMTLSGQLKDGGGRPIDKPSLTIVGNRKLITACCEYLWGNPRDYVSFLKELAPREKFPNINKGILDKIITGKSLYFFDTDRGHPDPFNGSDQYKYPDKSKCDPLPPEILEQHGRNIELWLPRINDK